jgi:hypothetical protein
VDWAFWSGTVIFTSTIVGMLWLRGRPLTDVDGRTVDDDDGRRVPSRDRRVRQVVRQLAAANNAPRATYVLRRLTNMSKSTFYDVVDYMQARHWLESITLDVEYGYRALRLTDHGLRTFNVNVHR